MQVFKYWYRIPAFLKLFNIKILDIVNLEHNFLK